jgi:hypothetical protein
MSRVVSIAAWCAAALSIHIASADAGPRPAWCGARAQEVPKNRNMRSEMERRLGAQGLTETNLSLIAQLSCDRHDDPKLASLIDGARARYQRLIGLTDQELGDAMRLRLDPEEFERQIKQTCSALRAGAEASEQDRVLLEARRAAVGCRGTVWNADWRFTTEDWAYWLDRDIAPVSELAVVAHLEQCLDHAYQRDFPDPEYDKVQVGYARCGVDARRLDRARLEQELKDPAITDAARQTAREAFSRAKLIAGQLTAAYQAKAATDPAWKKILLDAPEQAFTAWQAAATKWRPELDAVLAFEDRYYAPSKSAVAGCGPGLRAGWTKYLRAAGAKDAKAAEQVATADPIGYLLVSRLLACDDREGRYLASVYEGALIQHARRFRGPRRAAAWAVVDAINDIKQDREQFPISAGSIALGSDPIYGRLSSTGNKIGYGDEVQAEIKAVAKVKGGVKVTFKTVKYQVELSTCTPTNRLHSISGDGHLIWEQNCVYRGTAWRTSTEKPMVIPDEQAGGLAPNQFGTFRPDTNLDPRGGFPMVLYTDKSKKKLAVFSGVAL